MLEFIKNSRSLTYCNFCTRGRPARCTRLLIWDSKDVSRFDSYRVHHIVFIWFLWDSFYLRKSFSHPGKRKNQTLCSVGVSGSTRDFQSRGACSNQVRCSSCAIGIKVLHRFARPEMRFRLPCGALNCSND